MDKRIQIREILAECMDGVVPIEDINPELDLIDELHMDSIIYIQFIVMIEDVFNIEIPDDKLEYTVYNCYGELEDMIVSCI